MAVVPSLRRVSGLLLIGSLCAPLAAGAAEDKADPKASVSLAQASGDGPGKVEAPRSYPIIDWLFGGDAEQPDEAEDGGEAEAQSEPNSKVEIPIAPPLDEAPAVEAGETGEAGIPEKNPTRRYSLFGSGEEEPEETEPELGAEPESPTLPVVPDARPAPEAPVASWETAPVEAVETVPLPALPGLADPQPNQADSPPALPSGLLVEEAPTAKPGPDAPGSDPVAPLAGQDPDDKVERLGEALDELRDLNPVVALVQGHEIRWAEVLESAGDLPVKYQSQVEAIFPALLDRVIDLKLLTLAARKEGLSTDEDLRRLVTDYEDRLLRELYVKQRLGRRVTQAGVRARYDALVERLGSKQHLRARHILVDSEDKAKDLVASLEAGADFEALAREHSIGPSAERGGDLGYFDPNRMVPQFSKAALAMEVGSFSLEPVETPFGWHVIQLIDRRFTGVPPFEEMEASLREQLTQEVMDEVLGELRAENEIEMFPETPENQLRRLSAVGSSGVAADEAGKNSE